MNLKSSGFGRFLVHFPNFLSKKLFWKIWLCHAQLRSTMVSSTMPKFRKKANNSTKRPDSQKTDGRMDRLYFIGSYQLPSGVQYNFLGFFTNIWIENHFPLRSLVANFSKIIIQFSSRYLHIMGTRKQKCIVSK